MHKGLVFETFAHSFILLLFCGEVVFLYVEPKTKVKESVSLYKGFCRITKSECLTKKHYFFIKNIMCKGLNLW